MLFTSFTSNVVMKDISLAPQMAEGIIGHSLMLLKTSEWESLSFSSGARGCGLLPDLPENCSSTPTKA